MFLRFRRIVQRFGWAKLVLFLVLLLALLQILHVLLLSRLEYRKVAIKRAHSVKKLQSQARQIYMGMKATIENKQVLDSSGEYMIINQVYGDSTKYDSNYKSKAANGDRDNDVTLASQCSVNHIHHIAHMSKRWPGPVSVSVFASRIQVPVAVELLLWLYLCVPSMRYNVSVHIVTPFSHIPYALPSQAPLFGDTLLCGNIAKKVHQEITQSHNYALDDGVVYPNNLLRNVAWTNSHTGYVFMVDIDMLPNAELYENFVRFVKQSSTQASQVFVVPAFEIQPNIPIPQDKEQLLLLWNQNKVRPFYSELCWKCQKPTDYDSWKNLGHTMFQQRNNNDNRDQSISSVKIGYEVAWVDPWEPFFIAPRIAPMYDERFKQYGFNRISQVCELHIAGFKFSILDSAFLVHKGYKFSDGFHASKEAEQERNRLLFRQFKEELKTKYPESPRRCY